MSGVIQKYDRTENLFDGVIEQGTWNAQVSPIVKASNNARCRVSDFVSIEENKEYTVSLDNAINDIQCIIVYVDSTYSRISETTWQNLPYTFTTPTNTVFIEAIFRKSNNSNIIPTECGNLMLNTGSTAKPYQPHLAFKDIPYTRLETATDTLTTLPKTTYNDGTNATVAIKGNMEQSGTPTQSSPITPSECGERTENLFDKSNPNELNAYFSEGVIREGNGYKMVYIPCEPNTKYTVSKILTYRFSIAQFDHLPTYGSTNLTNVYRNNDTEVTLTTEPTAAYLVVFLYTPQDTVSLTDIYNSLMINKGNPHSYEPYGYKLPIVSGNTTTNIYLSEPLRKIGDYADTIAADGTVTRNIKAYEVTGQENWGVHGSIASWFYVDNIIEPIIPTDANLTSPAITSHFKVRPYAAAVTITNGECTFGHPSGTLSQFRTIMKNTDYTTAEDFIEWLKAQYNNGNPVTIWYASETPTTETITAPTIPTTSGGQTFDVDTTLKPSEVDLTYHGWHEHQPEQYINGEWT